MRLMTPIVAMLTLAACDSPPKSPPAASAATPAVDTPPRAFTSPDGSVRRSTPDDVITGRAPLASECGGEACGRVSVTWLDPGFRFENMGTREIAIRIWYASKGDCLRTEFSLAPGKNSGWGNTGFCKPYSATYK
jgi:hypothetical protein